jgi:hypothetical protein
MKSPIINIGSGLGRRRDVISRVSLENINIIHDIQEPGELSMNLWNIWSDLSMWNKFGLAMVASISIIGIIYLLLSLLS